MSTDFSLDEAKAVGKQRHGGRSTRRRWPVRLLVVSLIILAALAGLMAGRSLFTPPAPPKSEITSTVIVAEVGELQQSFTAQAEGHWSGAEEYRPVGEGTVTKRWLDGVSTIKSGTKLYDLNLIPTFAARGAVPMFRALEAESSGSDVTQLQNFLRTVGKRKAKANGFFDEDTVAQVKQWQESTKQPVTGSIPLGQFLFLPELPLTGFLADSIAVGSSLGEGGETSADPAVTTNYSGLVVLPPSPTFSLALSNAQGQLVEPGMAVLLRHGDRSWNAVIQEVTSGANDQGLVASLSSGTDLPVCGSNCDEIGANGVKGINAIVTVLPLTSGTIVPTTALTIGDSGKRVVMLEDGALVEVAVTASVGGEAIVTGIAPGTRLKVERRDS